MYENKLDHPAGGEAKKLKIIFIKAKIHCKIYFI